MDKARAIIVMINNIVLANTRNLHIQHSTALATSKIGQWALGAEVYGPTWHISSSTLSPVLGTFLCLFYIFSLSLVLEGRLD